MSSIVEVIQQKDQSSPSSTKDKYSLHKSSSSNLKDMESEKKKIDNKSSRDKKTERNHDKNKERTDKIRDGKSKSVKENKLESSHHRSSSSKRKHDEKHSHTSSKINDHSDKYKSSSNDKERRKDVKDKPEHKHSSITTTSKALTKYTDSAERKRRHNSDNDSDDFKSPPAKVAKIHKSSSSTEEEVEDSYDSSTGASFADILGMLNIPAKESKKSIKCASNPARNSNTIKMDTTPNKPSTSASSRSRHSTVANKVNGTISSKTPDLLAPSAKLEPLHPSTALAHCKPMPLKQTVTDCVVINAGPPNRTARTLTDFEAITYGISSKTTRTKMYSGVRTGKTYQAPSLIDMCIRILQKNIDALKFTGDVSFEILKPVLERAKPNQLHVFEEYNPHIMEASDVLWQQHVSRSYRTKKRLENESWREMFIRCQEEDERKLKALKESIKTSQKIASAPVRKTQLAFVDSVVKPPHNVLRKQEQYGTKANLVATPAARVASLSSVVPNAAKTGDQKLRVAATVKDHTQVKSSMSNKKAPLMQKTLKFIRGLQNRF